MSHVRRFFRRVAALVRFSTAESELAREIQAHLQLIEDQFVEKGMSRDDARQAARRAFGGVEQTKEHQRDARSFRWLVGWSMDLKLGARMLRKSPGLTIIGVVALAVAIGAGAAYLDFVNDLIRPSLSFPGADRIVRVRVWDAPGSEPQARALHDPAGWRREVATLEHLGAFRGLNRPLVTPDGRADSARGVEVSAAAFRLFPETPLMGRTLLDADEQPNAPAVVVIGEDLWQTRFNGDSDIVGRTVQLGPEAYTIAGVMPREFGFPQDQNLWAPLKATGRAAIPMFGRLKEGYALDAARAELSAMLPWRVEVYPYPDLLRGVEMDGVSIEHALYSGNLLFILLLAICGANVATLVVARTATREAEITVRTALGASRGRISAQLFAEALVLTLLAACVGLTLAAFIGPWLGRMATEAIDRPLPFWWSDRLGLETVLYAVGLAVFAALIVGIIPARKATDARLQGRLRGVGAGGSTMTLGWLWRSVIVVQVAITTVFLSVVVSLGWTMITGRQGRDVTFDRDRFLTARLVLLDRDVTGLESLAAQAAYRALADRLRAAPGVESVTYAAQMPSPTFGRFGLEFATPDVAATAVLHGDALWARSAQVGPGYFETIGIPLVAGRLFTQSEIEGNRPVAIVDETFVRLILGGRNAVGLTLREPPREAGEAPGPWHEIIGVVGNITTTPRKNSFDAMVYRPAAIGAASPEYLLVRADADPSTLSPILQTTALAASPSLRVADVRSLARVADEERFEERFVMRVVAVAAAVGLLLSTAGIYALVSFTLARRTREIGIRVALGAAPRRIISATFSRAFAQVAAGVLLGGFLGVGLLTGDDEGVTRAALGVECVVGTFVLAVALISCAVPLRRALRITPTEALRADA